MGPRRGGPAEAGPHNSGSRRGSNPDNVKLFIGAGRKAGIRPADLVGAITGEAGITSKSLGAIQIAENFSLIEVPEQIADDVVKAMKGASLRGQKVTIRRDRDS